jgi:hypothetical protein
MTYEKALAVAKRHLEENPLPHTDYRWRLSDGREVSEGWYFDYCFEPVRPIPEAEWEQFAGAPGFLVLRDKAEVRIVGWAEYRNLSVLAPSA